VRRRIVLLVRRDRPRRRHARGASATLYRLSVPRVSRGRRRQQVQFRFASPNRPVSHRSASPARLPFPCPGTQAASQITAGVGTYVRLRFRGARRVV